MKNISILFSLLVLLIGCESAKDKLSKEIKSGEAKLFSDTVKVFDKNAAEDVFRKYIAFADAYKDDTASAGYLFKAGDLANGLGRSVEAIEIYDRLRKTFPDYPKSQTALFMQGFIYETAVKDKEKAKQKYSEFIQKYPNHKLTPSAQASLDQLNANLSDEDLIKMFEAKNK